jgi:23S rRNA pseudouridine2604 synthase
MSELDLCSRREADLYISQSRVYLHGVPVPPILGQKVSKYETNISIDWNEKRDVETRDDTSLHWDHRRGDTVILHKPVGYVSGQPDTRHGHIPAVRLLTRDNFFVPSQDAHDIQQTMSSGHYLHFHRKSHSIVSVPSTLMGYVPAGRLDLDSSGLLIFTKCGVMAKKLTRTLPVDPKHIQHQGDDGTQGLEKEYRVHVAPVESITRYEREHLGLRGIPFPTKDLSPFLQGGKRLWNDPKPLKPLVAAEWLQDDASILKRTRDTRLEDRQWKGILRLVLTEGRKHQIRRMCREILGLHVTKLVRVRIGNVELEDLPEGKWRPLREREFLHLLDIM